MKGVLSKADGSLRIGLISLVIFCLLLIIPGIVIQFGKKMEPLLVKVKHTFIANPQPQPSISTAKPVKRVSIKKEQPLQTVSINTPVVKENTPQPKSAQKVEIRQPLITAVEIKGTESKAKRGAVPKNQPVQGEVSPPRPVEKIVEVTVSNQQPVAAKTIHAEPVAGKLTVPANQLGDPNEKSQSVTVDKELYRQLFQAWRAAGAKKIVGKKPALRVENLRHSFDSFNMKPVVFKGKHAFDLLDGSPLPDGFLANYAATVFAVKNPWHDWDAELKKIGLHLGNPVEVRYYMYSFIHNAIYARSQQAIDWAKGQGLLTDTAQQNLEVRGRAFQIKQQGGGRFGVFVPQQILTANGRQIDIAPGAFSGQPDIEQLQQAGVL